MQKSRISVWSPGWTVPLFVQDHLKGIPRVFNKIEEFKPGLGDVLWLWGGEDIGTAAYGRTPTMRGGPGLTSARDRLEIAAGDEALSREIPIFGVCRGAQMCCVLAGGELIQHVNGHGDNHKVKTWDGNEFEVTSTHHQMLRVKDTNHVMLAWADGPRSDVYECGDPTFRKEELENREPEVVYFPSIGALAIQFHPEYHYCSYDAIKWTVELFDHYRKGN